MEYEGKNRKMFNQFDFILISLFFLETKTFSSSSSGRKERHGLRKPKNIQIETYANVVSGEEASGVLPKSSREVTPLTEASEVSSSSIFEGASSEVKFFSGNPFVEQTTGILHLYKKKLVEISSLLDYFNNNIFPIFSEKIALKMAYRKRFAYFRFLQH